MTLAHAPSIDLGFYRPKGFRILAAHCLLRGTKPEPFYPSVWWKNEHSSTLARCRIRGSSWPIRRFVVDPSALFLQSRASRCSHYSGWYDRNHLARRHRRRPSPHLPASRRMGLNQGTAAFETPDCQTRPAPPDPPPRRAHPRHSSRRPRIESDNHPPPKTIGRRNKSRG